MTGAYPMLLLALSCLQGRPQLAAARQLHALGPDGIQLTPGNVPGSDFVAWRRGRPTRFRTHHGYSPARLGRSVWSRDGRCRVTSHSVHPPAARECDPRVWCARVAEEGMGSTALETMFPPHPLGTGEQLAWAMDLGLSLAVDVSHLHIQRVAGVLDDTTLRRLWSYGSIAEVHVSHNRGDRDTHRPVEASTFGLAWARERLQGGTPTVLECYMHRLDEAHRRQQLAYLRR